MAVNNKHAFDNLRDDAKQTIDEQITHRDERLVFRTDHLLNYQALDDLIAIEGKDYTPIKKAVWYSVIGALKPQYIKFSNIATDTRFNLLVVLPSGSGKDNVKQAIIKIMRACSRGVEEPATFHPEQLIGKVITRGKGKGKEYIQNPGHFIKDYLIFNEVYDFLTERDRLYKESRNYMTKALDPIGHNEVYKRLIDNLDTDDEVLRYCPRCTISMFLQPRYLDEDVVLSGFIRRYLIMYVPMFGKNLDRKEEIIEHVKTPRPEVSFEYWKEIAEWNCGVEDEAGHVNFTFEEGIDDWLVVLHEDLMEYARSLGEKQRNYLDRNTFALLGYLIKMAAIQAISRKSDVVTQEDVKLAYMDLFEFFKLTLDYVDAKVIGNLDYGEKWHGEEAKEIEALKWMVSRGALDEESSEVMVKEFKEQIANIFGIEERSAERPYSKLMQHGLINSKRVGKSGSKVWITFDHEPGAFDGDPVPLSDTLYWRIAHDLQVRNSQSIASEQVRNDVFDENDSKQTTTTSTQVRGRGSDFDQSAETNGTGAVLRTCGTCSTDSGSGDLQVRNQSPDSDFDKNTKSIAGDAKSDLDDSQVRTPFKLAQQDRMKAIDRFFRDRNITYANRDELVKLVPEIADELHISTDVAFRSVMQYGKDRGWV